MRIPPYLERARAALVPLAKIADAWDAVRVYMIDYDLAKVPLDRAGAAPLTLADALAARDALAALPPANAAPGAPEAAGTDSSPLSSPEGGADNPNRTKRWPFLESPGEFANRLFDAYAKNPLPVRDAMLAAVRSVLIENPPALANWALSVIESSKGEITFLDDLGNEWTISRNGRAGDGDSYWELEKGAVVLTAEEHAAIATATGGAAAVLTSLLKLAEPEASRGLVVIAVTKNQAAKIKEARDELLSSVGINPKNDENPATPGLNVDGEPTAKPPETKPETLIAAISVAHSPTCAAGKTRRLLSQPACDCGAEALAKRASERPGPGPIVTEFVSRPIPTRRFDWNAIHGYEPGDPIGWGSTESAAKEDLLAEEEGRS